MDKVKIIIKTIYKILKNMKINEVTKPIKRQSVLFLKLNEKKISKSNTINLLIKEKFN